jgi:nucleolar protein 6
MALKMHHTEILGRKINVEATAGGGGKSEARVKKIKEKNSKLHDQRVMKLEICSNLCRKSILQPKLNQS